jgi:hypothetical protein
MLAKGLDNMPKFCPFAQSDCRADCMFYGYDIYTAYCLLSDELGKTRETLEIINRKLDGLVLPFNKG